MRRRRGDAEDEPEFRAGELGVGAFVKSSPYDGLTDEQADQLQTELEEKDLRRLPFGFRA